MENLICPMCGKEFKPHPDMRNDAQGVPWCKECQDKHDDIDWQEIYERK